MRIYEDPQATSKNRLAPRDYYIPIGRSEYKPLNGQWSFAYFERDIDVPGKIENGIRLMFRRAGSRWVTANRIIQTSVIRIRAIPLMFPTITRAEFMNVNLQ